MKELIGLLLLIMAAPVANADVLKSEHEVLPLAERVMEKVAAGD